MMGAIAITIAQERQRSMTELQNAMSLIFQLIGEAKRG
jgi:hypothetical protein